ncbi:MAG TPA: FtsX-like permease family protein, partial [Vicinamibacteria bacterium]|nr:FtsX-like permease family protein [Vicinamibacteria bacterium]
LLLALLPGDLPRAAETQIDRSVLGFCTALSLLTALLSGALPALATTRRDPATALREGGRGLLAGGGRLGPGLVVAEVALAVTLLVGAGLLLRSFSQLRGVDPGFETPKALTFRTALPEAVYAEDDRRVTFYRSLEERLLALPGVAAVGSSVALPLTDTYFRFAFEVEGRPSLPPAHQPNLEVRTVTPGYFRAIGIPVLAGRVFTDEDTASAPQVAVLSREAVRRHFPDEDPLGKRITLGWGGGPGRPRAGGVVVGVVDDVKDHGLAEEHPAEIYLPHAQRPTLNMTAVVRTLGNPRPLAAAARTVLHGLDPNLPLLRVQTLEDIVARSIARPRFFAFLLAAFAAMALGLAALGVFGVLSYSVARRSREIGVRLALGARPGDVLRMVVAEAMRLVTAGLVLGLGAALVLARSLASLLFGLGPNDPATLGGATLVLAAAALAACALPSWRAARLDPLQALRTE